MSFDKRVNSFLAGSISVINAVVAIGYPALTTLMSGILMANLGPGGFSFGSRSLPARHLLSEVETDVGFSVDFQQIRPADVRGNGGLARAAV